MTLLSDLLSNFWIALTAKLVFVALFIPLIGIVLTYSEIKLSAKMQHRVGPYFAGGRWGWAQPIADGIKFFQKEDLIPAESDRTVFKLAPVLVFVGTASLLVVIPFGPNLAIRDLSVGVFYALAISTVTTLGVLIAGWSSGNKYSLMGGLRAAGQLIAYELPLVLAVVGTVIIAGTMSLDGIVRAQISAGYPFVIVQFLGFGIFMVAALAELIRIPFDMPVGESELVMGVSHRILRFPIPLLLHRRIRQHVLNGGHRRHPLPRRLLASRYPGSDPCVRRAVGPIRQGIPAGVCDDLVQVDLPTPTRGPIAEPRLEVANPTLAAQHHPDRRFQGGVLRSGSRGKRLPSKSRGLGFYL